MRLPPILDLREEIGSARLSAFQLGPDGRIWLAFESLRGGTRRLRVQSYHGATRELDLEFMAPPFTTHLVQPLGDDILLACSRCGCGSGAAGACAAAIYDRQGRLVRPLSLGEGIANLQATIGGAIWVGYLAEGDFGNVSWTRPAEQPGLARWSRVGQPDWVLADEDLDDLDDCYALNVVADDEVWFLHFPRFALVRLRDFEVVGSWDLPLAGGCSMAVAENLALVRCDEDDAEGERDLFVLYSLRAGGDVDRLGAVRFTDESGRPLDGARISARGARIGILHGGLVYHQELRHVAASLTLI
ncbi:MAG: hypothetical protein H6807_01305 [Planctomycetes bacterium]|nr:hypothetical protein [Planctomycetota bacterium]